MPTPKKRYLDSTPAVAKQQLAKMNKQANARERNIAKAYLEAGPNIVNLANAAYHLYNSVPWLGGKDENGNILVTGDVPTPGMRNPKSIVKGVKTINKAKAQKITPSGSLAKPVYKTINHYINVAYNKLPWTYKIPENSNMAYRRMGPLERDWLMKGNELSTRETNALTEVEEEVARAASKKGKRFSLFKAGAEHGGRKQFAKGQPWKGTTVTHGEEQVLAIPGKGLPWVSGKHYRGPQGNSFGVGDVSFEEAPFGSHIDLLTENGYSGVNPSLLEGSVIYSPYKIFGRNFGYKKIYLKNAARTPTITAKNGMK